MSENNNSPVDSLVSIKNPSFEETVLANGDFTLIPPPSWLLYNPNALIPANPTNDTSAVGTNNPPTINYFNEAPDGENTSYVLLKDASSGVAGIYQTLNEVLTANTQYSLAVDVGNPIGADPATGLDFGAGFPGYRIELLAGNTVVASENSTLQIAEGSFGTATVNFIAAANNPLLGQPLQIRLLNPNPTNPGIQVDFDNVRLKSEQVKDGSSIYINNAGFEETVLADGAFTLSPPSGWNTFDPFGFIPQPTLTSSNVGTFNPDEFAYVGGVPESQNVATVFLIQPPDTASVGLTQTLDTVVQANTQYTLSVDVGNPAGGILTGFPGYRVVLVAGNEVVAVDNNLLSLEDGEFATSNVSFTAAAGESFVGKNLGIRLINALNGEGFNVNFDNVSLKAEAASASAVTSNQTLYGSSGTTTLNGDLGNDIIFGNGLSTTLFGRDGNDQLFGASTDDFIGGGDGSDTIFGNGGKDILLGDAGNDIIFGGSQADIISGGAGNDTIYGNGGGDLIDGGTGNNTIFLGTGEATVALNASEGFDTINNFQLGSSRFFVGSLLNDLSFADSSSGVRISAGSDLLAVVSNQTTSTFTSNSSSIFKS